MIVSFLAAVLFLNSCLEDNVGMDWTSDLKGKMYAEVWKGGFSTTGLAPVPDPVVFKFLVNIATDALPTTDITLTIGVNDDARVRYNAAKGTAYQLYPFIEVLEPTIVIKAGTRNAYVHVKVWNADQLNACDNYMAPISILDATGGVIVADALNQGSRLMALPISNPYAADYNGEGYIIHPSAGLILSNSTVAASTIDCKTITAALSFPGLSPFDYVMEITSNTMVVLGVTCFKVNVTVIDQSTGAPYASGYGQYDTFKGSATTVPIPLSNDVNYYNPVTKTFVLNVYYNSSAHRDIYMVLTRL